jgi:putative N6-adenine-specific DNA methylase
MSESSRELSLFAVTAPGLEPLAAAELAELGVRGEVEAGGVAWRGDAESLYRANLGLRTASRVLVRIAEFRARTFFELERHARRVPWGRYVAAGRAVRVSATCHKSKLYHEGAVAERMLAAAEREVGAVAASAGGAEDEEGRDEQLFLVRFLHDRAVVSADASGALLHLRGYRQAVAKAPLRETLAAALLRASGWDASAPLVDPMCGAGTIPIEAALMARRIAPGLAGRDREPRRYAFLEWPDFDEAAWARVVERAREEILPAPASVILGSDRDAGAVEAARSNAERAGVEEDVDFEVAPLSALRPPPGPGWLVTNPPYGVRVGESAPLRDLYAALGRLARRDLPGWTLALLSADRRLEAQVGVEWKEALRTRNGGIPVRVVTNRNGSQFTVHGSREPRNG